MAFKMIIYFVVLELLIAILFASIGLVDAGIPVPEELFYLQRINHLDNTHNDGLWTQRYYTYGKHFEGPGHPIFLILGGEGGISPKAGILYPFVADHLAKTFGGFVLQPEHRFYGKSQPLHRVKAASWSNETATGDKEINGNNPRPQEDPRVKLFTSEQALYDALFLLDHIRAELGCSLKKDQTISIGKDSLYCPVIAVGGSYPGFLAAFARILFPDIVDMAYAASAPMGFYAQETDQFAYYNHITAVAEDTLQGCSRAVKSALLEVRDRIAQSQSVRDLELVASEVGICKGSIPNYVFNDGLHHEGNDIGSSNADFQTTAMINELMMVVGYTFANDNMANYPPGEDTRLYGACQIFLSKDLSPTQKVQQFLTQRLYDRDSGGHPFPPSFLIRVLSSQSPPACWNMTDQLPTGSNATISGGDWSGDGTGPDGESWDFQTCTLLVEAIGFSEDDSMFPPRNWTLDWMREHCQHRFGVVPRPYELVKRFHFGSDEIASTNTTRILFTNGLKDGWSVGGFQTNLSDSLIALNFENGAHHSDLSGLGPSPNDTEDIAEGYKIIARVLGVWLGEVSGKGWKNSKEQ